MVAAAAVVSRGQRPSPAVVVAVESQVQIVCACGHSGMCRLFQLPAGIGIEVSPPGRSQCNSRCQSRLIKENRGSQVCAAGQL